jgi:tripartite-type tricarboxylate transporter receptor subunit TctC
MRQIVQGRTMAHITRRSLVLAAMAAPFVARSGAYAQTLPGVIKITVPFPPGGTVDPIARMVQPGLQQRLGVTIVIENKPGASGSIGTAQVAKSPPDGSNWVFVFDTHAVNPLLQSLPFDTEKDLDPVLLIGTAPNIVSTHPARPFTTFADVVAAAKASPDTITYGSIGSGSLGHLTGVLLSERAGIRLVHVPYRGGGPAMNDAIAGHLDMLIGSAALVTPQVVAGKLRALAQTGRSRIAALPDTPTATELHLGVESYAWWGVFTTGGTPKPIVARFSAALAETLREPAIQKQLSDNLKITVRLGGPQEQATFLSEQMKLWGPVVREHGIKGD